MTLARIPIVAVVRRHDEGRSWIEPGLDPTWPSQRQAAWHVAVLQDDTGLDVELYSGALLGRTDTFGVNVPGVSSSGPFTLDSLATYCHGIHVGMRAARKADSQ